MDERLSDEQVSAYADDDPKRTFYDHTHHIRLAREVRDLRAERDDLIRQIDAAMTNFTHYLAKRTAASTEVERLRAVVAAVDALHQPQRDGAWLDCTACDDDWPCPTHLALHPQEDRNG